jgi:hypothetical protein
MGITIMPPTAVDARGKDVPVMVTEGKGTLTYDVDVTGVTWPVTVDPTSNVYASSDGFVTSSNETYNTQRVAETGYNANTSYLNCGQEYGGSFYNAYRSFMTLSIPSVGNILDVLLSLYLGTNSSTTVFDLYLLESDYDGTVSTNDWNKFDGWSAEGTFTGTVLNHRFGSGGLIAGYNNLVFNLDGRALVTDTQGSSLLLALLSSRDYNGNAPSSGVNEKANFKGSYQSGTSQDPYLTIYYDTSSAGGRRPRARYHGV